MQYVGIQTQQTVNNIRSVVLLCLFPVLVVLLTFLLAVLLVFATNDGTNNGNVWEQSLLFVRELAPFILGGVLIWFLIAYFANTAIIRKATGARPLERKENKRVYNLVENLCMSQGMPMPQINVIEDDSLNAFASGINNRTFTVSLSRGIINKLNDDELEAVIAHELSHIRNRDVRLLIVSIVFVGIFSMLTEITFRVLLHSPGRSRNSNNKNGNGTIVIILIALVVAAIGYFFSSLMRFAISRKREYLADAGSAEMTRKPQALASALRKISRDPAIEAVTRDDVAQLFIEHPRKKKSFASGINNLFATHPPIEERIKILEQF
jgi:heat shock protein HtpX